MTKLKTSKNSLALIIIISSIFLFTILNYGSIDDFMFQHIALTQKFMNANHIYDSDPIVSSTDIGLSGFYSFAMIFSYFTSISVLQIFLIPILLVPMLVILYMLLKKFCNNIILISFILLILSTYSLSSTLTYQPHGYALVLFICLIFIFIKSDFNIKLPNLILISLITLGINYLSYKVSFLLLPTLLGYLIIQSVKIYYLKIKIEINNYAYIILFTAFLILSVNQFFYNTALNAFKVINQSWFTYGIDKIIQMFFTSSVDLLSIYNISYVSSRILTFIISARFILLVLIIFSYMIFLFRSFINNKYGKIDKTNDWVLSLLFGIMANIIIYNFYGTFDPGLLIFPGFIVMVIYGSKMSLKKYVPVIIIIFLVFNSGYQFLEKTNQLVSNDNNLFSYLNPSEAYYQKFSNVTIYTDVLTRGYYVMKMVNQNVTTYPEFITNDDLFRILQINRFEPGANKLYVLNYRLSILSITNWRSIKPYASFQSEIDSNIHLNKVYVTPGDVSFYYLNTQ